jgi:hypothetical protein
VPADLHCQSRYLPPVGAADAVPAVAVAVAAAVAALVYCPPGIHDKYAHAHDRRRIHDLLRRLRHGPVRVLGHTRNQFPNCSRC